MIFNSNLTTKNFQRKSNEKFRRLTLILICLHRFRQCGKQNRFERICSTSNLFFDRTFSRQNQFDLKTFLFSFDSNEPFQIVSKFYSNSSLSDHSTILSQRDTFQIYLFVNKEMSTSSISSSSSSSSSNGNSLH